MTEPKFEWSVNEIEEGLLVDGVFKGSVCPRHGGYEAQIAEQKYPFDDKAAAKKWVERVALSDEFKFYEEAARAGRALLKLAQRVHDAPATIELCVFFGKITAACDILASLKDAGVPLPDPNEEAHPLEKPGSS